MPLSPPGEREWGSIAVEFVSVHAPGADRREPDVIRETEPSGLPAA